MVVLENLVTGYENTNFNIWIFYQIRALNFPAPNMCSKTVTPPLPAPP
jgi:hypothetical protein